MTEPFQSSRHDRPILVADWRDAEELAAWHMRTALGISGTALTGSGTDAGLDVIGDGAAAQVKHHQGAVGGPDIQRLRGAAHGKTAIFYALHGYTRAGVEAADATGIALYTYTVYGDVEPLNAAARGLVARSTGAAVEPDPELEEDVPLSVALSRVLTMTDAQEHDLQVFVVAELAEVLLIELELPDACYGRRPADADWLSPLPLAPKWQDFYAPVLAHDARVREDYRMAVQAALTLPQWVGRIERWTQWVFDALLRIELLARADRYTTVTELEESFAANADLTAGVDMVLENWGDRRPKRLSDDLVESSRQVRDESLRNPDLWSGAAWSRLLMSDVVEGATEDDEWKADEELQDFRRVRAVLAEPLLGLAREQVLDLLDEAVASRRFHTGKARVEV